MLSRCGCRFVASLAVAATCLLALLCHPSIVLAIEWDRLPIAPMGLSDHNSVVMPLSLFFNQSQSYNISTDLPPAIFKNSSHVLILFGGDTSEDSSGEGVSNEIYMLPWPLTMVRGAVSPSTMAPSPFPAQVWINPVPPVNPAARFQSIAVSGPEGSEHYAHMLFMFGGSDLRRTFSSLWVLDVRRMQWAGVGPSPAPALMTPTPLASTYAQVDAFYVNSFTTPQIDGGGCPWPGSRGVGAMHFIGNDLYLMFGLAPDQFNNPVVLGDVWKLSLEENDPSLQMIIDLQSKSDNKQFVWPRNTSVCYLQWQQLTFSGASANLTNANATSVFPQNRYGFASTVANGSIWLLGGITMQSQFADIWRLHVNEPSGPYWEQILPNYGSVNPAERFQCSFKRIYHTQYDYAFMVTGGQSQRDPASTTGVWMLRYNTSHVWEWVPMHPQGIDTYAPNSRGASYSQVPHANVFFQYGGIPIAGDPNALVYVLDMETDSSTGDGVLAALDPVPQPMYGGGPFSQGPYPSTRWQAYMASIGTDFWMFSGTDPNKVVLNDLWKYSYRGGNWVYMGAYNTSLTPQEQNWPTPRLICTWLSRPGANASIDSEGQLYLLFGHDGAASPISNHDVWSYDTKTATWRNQTDAVTSTTVWTGDDASAFAAGGIVRDGHLYPMGRTYGKGDSVPETNTFMVFGGLWHKNSDFLPGNDLWQGTWNADGSSIEWNCLSLGNLSRSLGDPAPMGRFDSLFNVWDNKQVWVAFGIGSSNTLMQDMWWFDIPTAKWNAYQQFPSAVAVYAAASVVVQNRWIIFGGALNGPTNSLWEMDFNTKQWRELTAVTSTSGSPTVTGVVPSARLFVNAASIRPNNNEYVMAFFGGEGSQILDDFHLLTIDYVHFRPGSTRSHDALALFSFNPEAFTVDTQQPYNHFTFATLAGSIAYHQQRGCGYTRFVIDTLTQGTYTAVSVTSGLSLINITEPSSIEGAIYDAATPAVLDCNHARCLSFYRSAANIEPFLIQNIHLAHGSTSSSGGGIRCVNVVLTIVNVIVDSCQAIIAGAGMSSLRSEVKIISSVFKLNVAGSLGGAISATLTKLDITDSSFLFNAIVIAYGDVEYSGGGGLLLYNSNTTLTNSVLKSNIGHDGGAISCLSPIAYVPSVELLTNEPTMLKVINCTFANNIASFRGSSIFVSNLNNSDPVIISDSSFIRNRVQDMSQGLRDGTVYIQASSSQFINSSFRNNYVSGGGGGVFWDPGDRNALLTAPPLFQNMSFADQMDNQALYGPFAASLPVSIKLINVTYPMPPQKSGSVIIPYLRLAIVDYWGSIVTTDSSTFITATPLANLGGTTAVQANQGIAVFSGLFLVLAPLGSTTLTFSASTQFPRLQADTDAGLLSVNVTAAACQPGEYNSGILCEQCPPGSYSDQLMADRCTSCAAGSFQPLAGQTSCVLCGIATASSVVGLADSSCPPCPSSQTTWAVGQANCTLCDVSTQCSRGSAVAADGYWLVPFIFPPTWPANLTCEDVNNTDSSQLYYCASVTRYSIACPWGYCKNGECDVNRINPPSANPLCRSCIDGYSEVNHKCVPGTTTNVPLLILMIVALFIFVCILHVLSNSASSGDLAVFFYFVQVMSLEVGDVKNVLQWTHFFRGEVHEAFGFAVVVPLNASDKLLLQFLSPLILIGLLCVLALLQRIMAIHRVGLKEFVLTRFVCFTEEEANNDYEESQTRNVGLNDASLSLQSNVGLGPALSSLSQSLLSKQMEEDYDAKEDISSPSMRLSNEVEGDNLHWRMKVSREAYLRTTLSIFLFTFQAISDAAQLHLYCVDVGPLRLVFSDPTIDCRSVAYKAWFVWLISILVVWVICLPVLILVYLIRHRLHIRQKPLPAVAAVASDPTWTMAFRDAFTGMLCAPYQKSAYYWTSIILCRRVILSAFVTVFSSDASARLCACSLLHIVLLVAHMRFKPYINEWNNKMETLSLTVLLAVSVMLQYQLSSYQANVAQVDPTKFSTLLSVTLTFLLLLPLSLMLAHWLYHKFVTLQSFLQTRAIRKKRAVSSLNGPLAVSTDDSYEAPRNPQDRNGGSGKIKPFSVPTSSNLRSSHESIIPQSMPVHRAGSVAPTLSSSGSLGHGADPAWLLAKQEQYNASAASMPKEEKEMAELSSEQL